MNLETFQEKLKSHPQPVIVDLWAPWCAPCRVTKPIVESLARDYEGKVDLWVLNVDEHSQLVRELNVHSIPTVLLTRQGQIVKKFSGSQSRENYRIMFEALSQAGETVSLPVSAFDRFLRLFAGTAIVAVGLLSNSWLLIPVGSVIAFLGIYDRCPIWRALTARLHRRTP